ncbi:MAG TPA: MFS transporter [Candidatus Acidoferrales bacterium]|nr:MFS transporter [Candidatus Acidoferrales bacterium]
MQPANAERLAVVAAYFCIFVGVGVWVPYFPLYLAHLGYTGSQIGLVIGIQPALRWCGALGWAYVADRWRNRHRVLVFTAGLGAICFVPLLVVRDIRAMLLVLTLIGLLHGTLIPMLDATVMDNLSTLGGDYGRLRLWGSLGFVVGSAGSAPLIHFSGPEIVPLLLVAPGWLMVLSLGRIPRTQLGQHAHLRGPWQLMTPQLSRFLSSAVLLQISCGTWSGFFAMHTTALGFSDAVPGFTYGLAVIFEIALMYWGRQMLDRYRAVNVLLLSLVITVVRWVLTAIATNEILVIALQLGHVFSFSAFHLSALRLLEKFIPRARSTSGQALYGAVSFGVGGTTGLWLAGWLVQQGGTRVAFGFEAAIAMLAVWPALRLRRFES